MTPPLAPGDVLASVRREIERNAVRARNGIKHVTGTEWAPPAPTPSETVWREGKAQLRRYRRGDASLGTPVLAFLGSSAARTCSTSWPATASSGA